MIKSIRQIGVLMGVLLLLCACSSTKVLKEGEYLLDKVTLNTDTNVVKTSTLAGYLRQEPNSRWASIAKVPLGIYLMANPESNSGINRFFRRMGEAPVVYDSLLSERSKQRIQGALFNLGYMHATVSTEEFYHKHKVDLTYNINIGKRFTVKNIDVEVRDTSIASEIERIADKSYLKIGMPFDANILNQERSRITNHFTDNGYYDFNRDFVRFEADTTAGSDSVSLKMIITEHLDPVHKTITPHKQYYIGEVRYTYDRSSGSPIWLKDILLRHATSLRPGELYRESNLKDTYSRISRLSAIAGTNVRMEKSSRDSSLLDVNMILTPARLNSIQLALDGTNTAGDLGAAANFTYQNRNVFHGSEVFSLKFRTAFEAIRGLKGYADQNYFEYDIEAGLQFPDFVFPFIPKDFRRNAKATSELAFMFASQDRPEFHRRVLTASWKYRWNTNHGKRHHKFDLLDINYVFMPWISDTFYDSYIKNPESRNAIIAYNYKNLFIVKMGYQYQYSSVGTVSPIGIYGKDAYTVRWGVETAGNLVHGICNLFRTDINEDGQRTLFNIAYAQYVKMDFDYCKSFRFSRRSSLALRFAFGVACPYGNSDILPYEKRYFGGGANSVRGWSVRSLGPGSFVGNDGRIDFINQTGDVKLDMSAELRMHMFWKFDGALFVDAGNIWTIRDYKEQPGGQFRFDTCWEQIAVAYGLGIRLNLSYFLLRFDAGMKAINPAYQDAKRHYPIIHPNFKRDFAFHFAVGLPF